MAAWFLLDQDNEAALQAMLAGVGLLQLGMLILLFAAMMNSPRGTGSVTLLMLAICGFLLLGGVFGAAAALLEIGSPGSFSDPTETIVPLPWQSLLYGSLVTLSAIGFGDVTPISSWARSLFSLEGIAGVLFVAVVISRMVSVAGEEIEDDD